MIIDCISDLHGNYPQLDGGDLLIVAGDLTGKDTLEEHCDFKIWLHAQDYKKKIVVAGNHDNHFIGTPSDPLVFSTYNTNTGEQKSYADYLCDSGTEFECIDDKLEYTEYYSIELGYIYSDFLELQKKKIKIWGSPWTLAFEGMNPKCKAFTCNTEEELAAKFALIPDDVDILVTHSPPWGYFDHVESTPVGSQSLLKVIQTIRPKLCVFGHIHEGGGGETQLSYWSDKPKITKIVNSSHVNEHYKPVNKPIRINL